MKTKLCKICKVQYLSTDSHQCDQFNPNILNKRFSSTQKAIGKRIKKIVNRDSFVSILLEDNTILLYDMVENEYSSNADPYLSHMTDISDYGRFSEDMLQEIGFYSKEEAKLLKERWNKKDEEASREREMRTYEYLKKKYGFED